MKHIRKRVVRVASAATASITVAVLAASPAYAAEDPGTTQLKTILDNATAWLVGILAAVATLFLTVGGIRYLMAGGDPGEVEKDADLAEAMNELGVPAFEEDLLPVLLDDVLRRSPL